MKMLNNVIRTNDNSSYTVIVTRRIKIKLSRITGHYRTAGLPKFTCILCLLYCNFYFVLRLDTFFTDYETQ